MATSQGKMKSGLQRGARLTAVMAGMGITVALTTGQAFSSGQKSEESYERHVSERSESKIYGTVEKAPSGRVGSWVVNGREIAVTRDTRIKEEYGTAAVGAYVEVEGSNTGKLFSAHKIEVKRAKK